MAMNDYKITQEQLANRRVQDAPDQPQGTAQQVKALFDNIALNVVIPAFNALVDALGGEQAAGMTGAQPIEGLDGVTVQALLQSLKELCDSIIQTADNDRVYAQQIENTVNQHYANEDNPHNVTKEQVGLGNCDNTADLDKPVSQAQKAYTDQIVAGAMMGTIPDNSLQLIKLVPEVQRLIEYAIQPSGGTMIGNIKMTQGATVTGLPNPTGDTDAVSKAYLIAQFATRLAGYLSVSGGTMTGAINMNSKKIISLPVPSASKDAATKEYVDQTIITKKFRLIAKITTSKSWSCPSDVTQITVILVGGGAGGTDYNQSGQYPGAAAGCSGTSFLIPKIQVIPGKSYQITIGAGGGKGHNPGGHTSAFGFTALGAPACFGDSGMEVTGIINSNSTQFGGSSPGDFHGSNVKNIRGGGEIKYRAGGAYDKVCYSINSFVLKAWPDYIPDGAIPWFTELLGNTLLASGGKLTGQPPVPNTGNGGNGATIDKPSSGQAGSSGVVYIYA